VCVSIVCFGSSLIAAAVGEVGSFVSRNLTAKIGLPVFVARKAGFLPVYSRFIPEFFRSTSIGFVVVVFGFRLRFTLRCCRDRRRDNRGPRFVFLPGQPDTDREGRPSFAEFGTNLEPGGKRAFANPSTDRFVLAIDRRRNFADSQQWFRGNADRGGESNSFVFPALRRSVRV
jgi:hypothetical protein